MLLNRSIPTWDIDKEENTDTDKNNNTNTHQPINKSVHASDFFMDMMG
jgi:hypothetical protein